MSWPCEPRRFTPALLSLKRRHRLREGPEIGGPCRATLPALQPSQENLLRIFVFKRPSSGLWREGPPAPGAGLGLIPAPVPQGTIGFLPSGKTGDPPSPGYPALQGLQGLGAARPQQAGFVPMLGNCAVQTENTEARRRSDFFLFAPTRATGNSSFKFPNLIHLWYVYTKIY